MFRQQTREKRTFNIDVAEARSMASRIQDDAKGGIVPRLCTADVADPDIERLENRTQKIVFNLGAESDILSRK
jgi:hypothetical protein